MLSRLKPLLLIAVISNLLLVQTKAYAFGMRQVFDNLHVNVTNAGSYHDAAAGYHSGGSAVIRTRSTAINPVSVSPASVNTGCGSIDVFLGSFSMVSGAELITLVERLGSEAPIYALHLGMKTYAPQIEQTLKDLRDKMLELNQFGIGHCKVTQSVFAAALPQNSAMYETVCNEMAEDGGLDLFGQRKKCRSHQEQKAAVAQKQERDPNALIDNYNIFIRAARMVGIPEEMHSTLMSMTGTIVVKDGVIIPYPSLANDTESWNIHINGGSGGSMYHCDNRDCLNVTVNNDVTIENKDSYAGKAREKLNELKLKIIAQREEFNEQEKGLLDSLGQAFPIFDHITLEAITGISILDSDSQLVARYMLMSHLKKVTNDIRKGTYYIKNKQISDTVMKDYEQELTKLLKYAENEWNKVMSDADRVNERAEKIEKLILARERG